MSLESIGEIMTRIAARRLGVKFEPLPVNSTPTALDVEDAFLEDAIQAESPAVKSSTKPGFDSEPE